METEKNLNILTKKSHLERRVFDILDKSVNDLFFCSHISDMMAKTLTYDNK